MQYRYLMVSFMMVVSNAGVIAAEPPAAHSAPPIDSQALADAQNVYGVREETPNERRRRLGQPIEASFPAPDYGEALETPNQRRARLATGLADQEAKRRLVMPEQSALPVSRSFR
jgi:hypothetical protein